MLFLLRLALLAGPLCRGLVLQEQEQERLLPKLLPLRAPGVPAAGSGLPRRAVLAGAGAALAPLQRAAAESLTLEDLPKNSVTTWKQYWPVLQLATDYFVFELRDQVAEPNAWDYIGQLCLSKDVGSAQSPSRLEREFINPMRILSLAFPPDAGGDDMQVALNGFQQAMFRLRKKAGASPGPTARPSQQEIDAALKEWDDARLNLNKFIKATNDNTGVAKLVPVPAKGAGYPRSAKLYTTLKKNSKICQNRGGEALAGIWGQLMVYGTVINPCGDVTLANYFEQ